MSPNDTEVKDITLSTFWIILSISDDQILVTFSDKSSRNRGYQSHVRDYLNNEFFHWQIIPDSVCHEEDFFPFKQLGKYHVKRNQEVTFSITWQPSGKSQSPFPFGYIDKIYCTDLLWFWKARLFFKKMGKRYHVFYRIHGGWKLRRFSQNKPTLESIWKSPDSYKR